MEIVLSVGGSMINSNGKPNVQFLKDITKIIKESRYEFGILCGGGISARLYANVARDLGASEYDADNIAIISTKQNAALLITALFNAGVEVENKVFDNFDDAKRANKRVVVMGGTIPGITTDTDSVLLAEAIGAKRLINLSNIDAIYDSDPEKNPNAKRFTKMTYDELIKLALQSDKRMAGTNFVFDLLACKLIARSKIETHFVSGKNLSSVKAAIDGKKHNGTVVE